MKRKLAKLLLSKRISQVQQIDEELYKRIAKKNVETIVAANFRNHILDFLTPRISLEFPVKSMFDTVWTVESDKIDITASVYIFSEKEILELLDEINALYVEENTNKPI